MENVRETENAVRADINGCHLLLIFEEQPVEGVCEKIRGILSSSYDERVLKDLAGLQYLRPVISLLRRGSDGIAARKMDRQHCKSVTDAL